MFNKSIDDRLSSWASHRVDLEDSPTPLEEVWKFWKAAPFIPYNRNIDPFHQYSWPTPWNIIVENKYDDFTKALMIAWTLKLTNRFKNSKIEIKTLIDKHCTIQYNIVSVDDIWAINYDDNGPVASDTLLNSLQLENLIEITDLRI